MLSQTFFRVAYSCDPDLLSRLRYSKSALGIASRIYPKILPFYNFNPENATGHYRLNLGDCMSFAVAQQMLLLDRWETSLLQQLDRVA